MAWATGACLVYAPTAVLYGKAVGLVIRGCQHRAADRPADHGDARCNDRNQQSGAWLTVACGLGLIVAFLLCILDRRAGLV